MPPVASDRPVAVVVNLTDGGIVLPKFYLSKKDKESGENPQKLTLGAAMDRGADGVPQPDLPINAYTLEQLKDNAIFRGFVARRWIDVRTPSLDMI